MAERYDRRFEGVWIPRNIWLSESLTLQEKAFLVEIKSLDNEQGCFASNEHFSKFFQLSKSRCSEVINKLKEKNLVDLDLIYSPGTKQVEKRIIRVNYGHEIFMERGIRNIEGGIREAEVGIRNPEAPPSEKAEDNKTLFNKTINNTTNKQQVVGSSVEFGYLAIFYEKNIGPLLPVISQELGLLYDNFKDVELIQEAFKIAIQVNAKNKMRYADGILRNWKAELITTFEQLKAKEVRDKNGSDQRRNESNGNENSVDLGF
ncbi:MAG TPA: DnaD domain protein [Ureibacillus sp.]|nr:DnaD domain protein [Ureibacillus sp.]